MEIDWAEWEQWTNFKSLSFSTVPTGAGAYVIATDRPLQRAVGTDADGIIDVGQSAHLRQRLRAFRSCATNRYREGHMAGWRFGVFRLAHHFPLDTLLVRWKATRDADEARGVEADLMFQYFRCHTELPPLNYSFTWANNIDLKIFDDEAVWTR
ncbi:MAG: hypothetical protein KAY37_02785 [Phycisphaerae bacterium]|nr:hypothetical protein [Phycisphaerae bacterium]